MIKNNKEISKQNVVVENEKILLAKKKEHYESIGIPVERLYVCHGLPMTS